MTTKKTTKPKNKESNTTRFQKFITVTINRQKIKNAPYNPRIISDENFNTLKRNLRKIGLLETLVWNKTTGNLVSGHQRLKILDMLEKRDDYDLTVAMVELDPKTEMEQNIFMNNKNAMGDWDRDLLLGVVPKIDLKEAGFDEVDMAMIGIELDIDKHQNEDVEEVIQQFEKMKELDKKQHQAKKEMADDKTGKQKDWKEVKKEIAEKQKETLHEDYIVLSFDNYKNKEAFLQRFGFDKDDRYIKGEVFDKMIERVQ